MTYSGVGGAAGHPTAANVGNGTYSYSASYDNDLRLATVSLSVVSTGTTDYATSRSYDAAGNVTNVNSTLAAGTDNQAFCYDEQNRLVWADATGTPSCGGTLTAGTLTSAQYTQTFAYDALNRLTSIGGTGATGGASGTYTYGDSAHLHAATATASSGYGASYDAAGDMICRAPTSATTCTGASPTGAIMAYDAERRLVQYQDAPTSPSVTAYYLYDGEGNRVQQAVVTGTGTATTTYLPGGVEEVRPDGGVTKYYTADGLAIGLNTATDDSGISYLASDGLGSVSESLDGSGGVTSQQLFAPYGATRYTNGVWPTTKGFTGQRSDAAVSGLDYYGARYYDPLLGQFTSADSAAAGLNRYGYVKGNPETFTDPTGHRVDCFSGNCGSGGGSGGSGGSSGGSSGSGGGSGEHYCNQASCGYHDGKVAGYCPSDKCWPEPQPAPTPSRFC